MQTVGRKRVLFVYYLYPPLVGGWRAVASVTAHFRDLGWEVTVLSAADTVAYDMDYPLLDEVPEHIEVVRVDHRSENMYVRFLLRKLKVYAPFPDGYRSWLKPALAAGRKLLRESEFDAIWSYGPPVVAHYVARQLKQEFGLPWFAESADPWLANTFAMAAYKEELLPFVRKRLLAKIKEAEQMLLTEPEQHGVVSWCHQQHYHDSYGVPKERIPVLNNGYDEKDFVDLEPMPLMPDRLTIVFIGTYYTPFGPAFETFLEVLQRVAPNAEVIAIGRNLERVNAPNLTRILYMEKQKALNICAAADYLLLMMPEDGRWIPMKVYDYLRLRKPMLALVPDDGDVARLLRRVGFGHVVPLRQPAMEHALQEILSAAGRAAESARIAKADDDYIEGFERRNLAARITAILDRISVPPGAAGGSAG